MVIFMDGGAFVFLVIIIASVVAGSVMTLTEWILNHLLIVAFALFFKALIIIGLDMGIFSKGLSLKRRMVCVVTVCIDMLRSGIFLWAITDGVVTAFSGDMFHLLLTGFALLVVGPILYVASCAPVYILGDPSPLGEIVSLIAIIICCLILYVGLGGW